ncbi:uncharacterized protein CLUP02_02362 [Colletotrichum lupini]|uniref:Uncharacterized protein n=1 Tax=Colletotrichum lupini TaxID=145971 RepID=A0A9Q8SE34_9PEZI|nr:uncharacterized protein CLUP02_02362 [Colletotrichum lupini]UQC75706.1 hypothetical protein CLUP02_02362 [Colletotrichum lupini]
MKQCREIRRRRVSDLAFYPSPGITAATAGTSVHPLVYDMGVDSGRQFPVGLQGRSGGQKISKDAAAYAVAFLFGIDAPT